MGSCPRSPRPTPWGLGCPGCPSASPGTYKKYDNIYIIIFLSYFYILHIIMIQDWALRTRMPRLSVSIPRYLLIYDYMYIITFLSYIIFYILWWYKIGPWGLGCRGCPSASPGTCPPQDILLYTTYIIKYLYYKILKNVSIKHKCGVSITRCPPAARFCTIS